MIRVKNDKHSQYLMFLNNSKVSSNKIHKILHVLWPKVGFSGTRGFEVPVWSGLQIFAGFGFHFKTSGFRVYRVPTQHY